MNAGEQPTDIKIKAPPVRARTKLHWTWQLLQRDGGKQLASGESSIHVFPRDLLADLPQRIGDRRLFVMDSDDGLPRVLESAKVPFTRLLDAATLQAVKADMILIGADQLAADGMQQSPLIEQARAGASVMFFAQKIDRLADYALADRSLPAELKWRRDHPLLSSLDADDLASWLSDRKTARAVQLPKDEPALEITYWPRKAPGDEPAPIDTLLVSRSTGGGRIVLCQLPLGRFDADPRSQLLLCNAIDYLLTRPEPTPPASRRPVPKLVPTPATVPSISYP